MGWMDIMFKGVALVVGMANDKEGNENLLKDISKNQNTAWKNNDFENFSRLEDMKDIVSRVNKDKR